MVSEKKAFKSTFLEHSLFPDTIFLKSGVRYKCNNINSLDGFDTTFSIFLKKLFILKCEKKI